MLQDDLTGTGEVATLDDEFFSPHETWSPADDLIAEVMAVAGQTDRDSQY